MGLYISSKLLEVASLFAPLRFTLALLTQQGYPSIIFTSYKFLFFKKKKIQISHDLQLISKRLLGPCAAAIGGNYHMSY